MLYLYGVFFLTGQTFTKLPGLELLSLQQKALFSFTRKTLPKQDDPNLKLQLPLVLLVRHQIVALQ